MDISKFFQSKIDSKDPEFLEYINNCVAEFLIQNLSDADVAEIATATQNGATQEQIEAVLSEKIPDFKKNLALFMKGKLNAISEEGI